MAISDVPFVMRRSISRVVICCNVIAEVDIQILRDQNKLCNLQLLSGSQPIFRSDDTEKRNFNGETVNGETVNGETVMARSATRTTASLAARNFAGASPPLSDRVPIPPSSTFNQNLSSADEGTMIQLLGIPGQKSDNCSPATGDFKTMVKTASVGPFRVTGLDVAVDLLKAAFDDASEQIPDVVAAAKTAGMLCVRHKRNNANSFSNHSWGTAIDMFFGQDVVPQGVRKTDRGCLLLVPFLNSKGFFWGGGFTGSSVDSMHFELSRETIRAKFPR